MTNQLTTMLATPYYVDTTSITVTTDVTSSEVKTLPAGYYIPYLKFDNSAEIAGVTRGTLNDPYEVFLKFVSASSPTYFSFSLTSQGKTQIEYLGTGSGNITFSYITQKMLGFKSSSLSFASQAVKHVSDYSPYGSIFSFAKTNNTGWTKTPQGAAYSMTPDGYVWGYKNSYDTYTQKFNLRFHPKDQATQLSDPSINSTPLYFPSKSIYLSNLENPLTVYYSWNNLLTFPGFQQGDSVTLENLKYCAYTVQEFLQQCPGQPIHALLGNLQQCISGSNKEYLVVFQTPESIKKENQFKPSLANFDKLYDVEDFEISFYKKFTTNTLSSSYVTASTASFAPTDITGLQLWLRSDDLVQANGTVSQVNDKSGNGRHAVQAVSSSQPYYFANGGLNNLPYWQGFSASSSGRYLLAGANGDFDFMHNGSNWTLIYIASAPTFNSSLILGTQQASSNNIGFSVWEYTNPGVAFYMGNNTTTVISKTQTTGFNSGSWNTAILKYTDSATPALSGVLNTTIETTANKAATPTATSSGRKFGIGSSGTGQFSSNTKFAEVIIYNKTLTAGEISQIQDYIFDRYVATPADLPGLSVWYQADDIVLSASKISQFNDKSGNGRHATNSNATYQVTQSVDAAYNSKTIAVTNGSPNQVYTPTSFTISQPLTVFAIGDGNGTFGADWETWLDSANANRIILRMNTSHYFAVYAGSTNVDLTSTVNSKTTSSIAWCEYNGASSKGNVNSATATTLASNPGTNSLTQPIILAGYSGGYPMANGAKFAATLVFNRQLSTTERNFVLNYFSSYYGITVSGL